MGVREKARRRKRAIIILYSVLTTLIVGGGVYLVYPRVSTLVPESGPAQIPVTETVESPVSDVSAEPEVVVVVPTVSQPQSAGQESGPKDDAVETSAVSILPTEAEQDVEVHLSEAPPEEEEPVLSPPIQPEAETREQFSVYVPPIEEEEPVQEKISQEVIELVSQEGQDITSLSAEPEVRVPSPPPVLYVYVEEPWDFSNTDFDDDFFADFYYGGGDMVYDDGIQYPYIYVNGEYYGSIQVDMRSNSPFVSRTELQALLQAFLEPGFASEFFSSEEAYYGEEYMSSFGIGLSFDTNQFIVYLEFSAEQLPIQSVSLSSQNLSHTRTLASIVGVSDIDAATLSWSANLSLYGYLGYSHNSQTGNWQISAKNLNLTISNMVSFCDLALDFTASVDLYRLILATRADSDVSIRDAFYVSRALAYIDFPDDSLRLSIGSVSAYSAIEPNNPFGFSLEKSYSYGNGEKLGNQFEQEIILEQDCTVIVFMNGMEAFSRKMKVGKYRLKDFTFVQGANEIEIWEVPEGVEVDFNDPAPEIKILSFNLGYDSSLMAKGEYLWKFTYSFPSVIDDGTFAGFHYVDFNLDRYVAKFSDFSLSLQQAVGLTHSMTINNLIALSGSLNALDEYSLRFYDSFSAIQAFNFGSLNYTAQIQIAEIPIGWAALDTDTISWSASITPRFNEGLLAAVSTGLSYDSSGSRWSASLGYGWTVDDVRFSLSGSASYTGSYNEWAWSLSGSLNTTLVDGIQLNASLTTSSALVAGYANGDGAPVRGSIGLSFQLGSDASAYTRSDYSTIDASLNWKPFGSLRSSIQLALNGIRPTFNSENMDRWLDHSMGISYSYNGELVGLSLRQNFSNSYQSAGTTISLNTAVVFADGQFGMARSVAGSFLLVHPDGLMKNVPVSIGKATASSSTQYRKVFGNYLYTGLSLYQHNGIVIYSDDSSLFGSGGTFLIGMTPRPRQGYVMHVAVTPTVTMSAILYNADGTPNELYTSPIYRIYEDIEDGQKVYSIQLTDNYMFTDETGRFIQSNLEPGLYCIDLDVTPEGSKTKVWYGLFFEVPVLDQGSQVILLQDFWEYDQTVEEIQIATDIYERSFMLREVERESETEFWDKIFAEQESWSWEDDWTWYDETQDATVQTTTNSVTVL